MEKYQLYIMKMVYGVNIKYVKGVKLYEKEKVNLYKWEIQGKRRI